jgi:hypothetical protein
MYAKLFTSIYQGTLRGNSHGLLVFTNLLAHADSEGAVDVHPRAIAEEVGLTVEQVKAAITVLESVDIESRSPECEGRRIVRMDEHRDWGWRIVNYVKYRAIRNEDDRREQNRLAQQRFREKVRKGQQSQPRKPESAQAEAEVDAKAKKKKTDAPAALVGLEGVPVQTLKDWIKVRREKRLPLTQTALDAILVEIAKTKHTTASAIKLAAEMSWAGFKASWLNDDGLTPKERGTTGAAPAPAQQTHRQQWAKDATKHRSIFTDTTPKPEIIDVTAKRLD